MLSEPASAGEEAPVSFRSSFVATSVAILSVVGPAAPAVVRAQAPPSTGGYVPVPPNPGVPPMRAPAPTWSLPNHNFGPSYPFGYNYTGPSVPSAGTRWIPGHWAQVWVPQNQVYSVWVDGYYAADGSWVDGHYEQQVVPGGGYRQVWVNGYWAQ
jgi:hypothetical protein